MPIYRSLVATVGLLFLLTGTARAEYVSSFNAWDMGWYGQAPHDSGHHTPSNLSYLAGRFTYPEEHYSEECRNFFVFDLTGLSGIVSEAKLTLKTLATTGTDETYQLYDVETAILTLVAGGTGHTAIFDDLGNGSLYGSCDVPAAPPSTLEIELSPAFLLDATRSLGSRFAIGGTLTTLSDGSGEEYLFGYNGHSRQLSEARLTLTVQAVPEPTGLVLLLIGAVSMFGWTCNRRSALPNRRP